MSNSGRQRDGKSGVPLPWSNAVLVLTQDPATGGQLIGALQGRGLAAVLATTTRWALSWTRRISPSLIVLDLRADRSRFLLSHFREEGRTLIALSEDGRERVWALQQGCRDAFPVSVDAAEFALKIAKLQHAREGGYEDVLSCGPLVVDLIEHRFVWSGREIAASPLMLKLAACLARHQGQFLSPSALLEDVWSEPLADPNRVHQAIWRLRRLLGEQGASSLLVAQGRGLGYGLFSDDRQTTRPVAPHS